MRILPAQMQQLPVTGTKILSKSIRMNLLLAALLRKGRVGNHPTPQSKTHALDGSLGFDITNFIRPTGLIKSPIYDIGVKPNTCSFR